MKFEHFHLCLIGNMLGRNPDFVTTQGQIVADLFVEEGMRVTCASSKINKFARLLDIVTTVIKGRNEFDVVILEVYSGLNFIVSIIVGVLCKLLNLRLIMVLHGGNLPEFVKKHPLWSKFTFAKAKALVAPSRYLAEELGVWGFNVNVISNVVEIGKYEFRQRRQISPTLFWMRSFHPIYNPALAVKVLAGLCSRGRDAFLVMAGNDKGIESETKLLVDELGLSGRVRFAGFLDSESKKREFEKADIYLNTNRIDNMPVSLLEARAFGLPVIATNVGGLPYIITHEIDGMLVPDQDVESMVKCVELLLDDPHLTQSISRNGRNLAEKSAWSNVRVIWEELIMNVAGKSRKKSRNIRSLEKSISRDEVSSKL